MAAFKKGDNVRLKAVVPQGPVIKMAMDDDGNVSYLLEWTDADGQVNQRWFQEGQLEAA
jgi:uncharacterized protein YodC (DUF2158 family)